MDFINGVINDLASLVAHPLFYVAHPGQRIYFVYLVSAIVLAFWVYLTLKRRDNQAPVNFFTYCFPKEIYTHPSAILDYKFFFVNRIAFALFLGTLILSSSLVSELTQILLGAAFPSPTETAISIFAAGILLTIAVVLAQDFGVFYIHYLMHKVPFLWEFHKIHHSAQTLTPMTVYRMHPVDDILTGSFSGALMGVVYGVFAFGFANAAAEIKIFHLNAVVFVFYLAGYNLRHSHIWLPLKGFWGKLLISPAHHQIHHSSELRHADKNMGFIFGVWDWMFGTLYIPEQKESFRFGLHGGEDRDYDTLAALYFLPFRKATQLLRGQNVDAQA